MIKVGKYTAALLLVTIGTLLLIDLSADTNLVNKVIHWWPVIIIALGLEYLVLGAFSRDPSKKIGIAFGSVIFAVVLSVGVVIFTSSGNMNIFSNWNFSIGSINLADESGIKVDKGITRAPISSVQKVLFRNHNGDITVRPGDVSELEIHTTLYVPKSKEDEANDIAEQSKITVSEKGSTLEIITVGKEYRVFGVKQKPRMNLVVTVPRNAEKNFEVDLTNGKVDVKDISVDQTLTVDTTNGRIDIQSIHGNVTADTTNGNVKISDITGNVLADTTNGTITAINIDGKVTADTTNGKIIFNEISGSAEADTTNGSVEMTNVENAVIADTTNGAVTIRSHTVGGNWELETTNGRIDVYVPTDASFRVEGESGWGKVTSEFSELNIDKKEVSGTVNGGQYKLEIDTNSGIGIYKN